MKFIEKQNDGNAVIFLHGFPNNSNLWEHQLSHFGSQFHTICAEWSLFPPHSLFDSGVNTLVNRIREFKATFPAKTISLVGHDMGCFFASEVSQTIPNLIDSQVFINGVSLEQYSLRWKSIGQWLRSSYVTLLNLPGAKSLVSGRFSKWILNFFYSLGGAGKHSPLRGNKYNHFSSIGIYQEITSKVLRGYISRNQTPKNPVPTTLVYGENDPFLIIPSHKEVQRCYSVSNRIPVPGGHWLPFTHAFAINQILELLLTPQRTSR